MTVVDGAERWACRLESYLTDPRVEPDPSKGDRARVPAGRLRAPLLVPAFRAESGRSRVTADRQFFTSG
ncbi:hypothetical protein [Streptomyces sp. SLBN-118]|uniref:hypothetical protein n=1 Tax=Streptomyces sp. SLBN-118 TaxID=2768454 RepID=UPI0021B2F242|nr:hypothetical protein [Streptomyces sp. SLBN-118]